MCFFSVRRTLVLFLCVAIPGCWSARAQAPGEGAGASPSTGTSQADSLSQSLTVAAQSEIHSQTYHLKPGNGFEVTGNSDDARFSVDLFVYNADKELVGKDDPDSTEASFKWQAVVEGDYYVLARNTSDGAGTIHIAVTGGAGKTRGIGTPSTTGNYAVVKVFYATDRAVSGSDSRGPTFGGDPDPNDQLHYGEVAVSIPRDHRMGELEGPSIWRLVFKANPDPTKEVLLQSVEPEDESVFMKGVSARVTHSQKKEILVFVHGFNTSFEDASRRTAQLAYDMAFDGPTVLYSWPSQASMMPIAYNKDGRNSALTTPHLEAFLKELVAKSGATTVDLIAHSMGNRPVTQALRDFAIENPNMKPMFNQVALMAPDVDAALFQQMAKEMQRSASRITLYASSRDAALKASEIFAGYQRAGEGLPHLLVLPGMDTVDASAVDTSMLGFYHSYFADSTTVLSDLFRDFRGLDPKTSKVLKAVVTAAGQYWKFVPSS
jgi:esterase/lipase superfamily enzyme